MYPFEVYDETTKRVEFYFNLWEKFKNELQEKYPVNDKLRLELELVDSVDRLKDVKTDWNPHVHAGNYWLDSHDCFYYNKNWSVIFDVYPSHNYGHRDSIRFLAEEGHIDPLGEKLTL